MTVFLNFLNESIVLERGISSRLESVREGELLPLLCCGGKEFSACLSRI